MPHIPRRQKERRTDLEELNDAQRQQLIDGKCWHLWADKGYQNADELRAGWELHGEKLLAEYIENHPGNRPFAWWFCEHQLERPIINPTPDDADTERNYRAETFGFLDTSICVGLDASGKWLDWQEPQHLYLRRHGLLTPEELEHPDLESEAL